MQLPNVLKQTSAAEQQFLACHITESAVTVAIWQGSADQVEVLKTGTPKEWSDMAGLPDAFELALSDVMNEGDGSKPQQMLFGLPDQWVEGSEVKAEYKEILKQLTQKNELKPAGFVVSMDALYRLLTQGEVRIVAFFTLTSGSLVVQHVQNGTGKQKVEVGRSDHIVDDAKEALTRLYGEKELVVPTTCVLFSETLPFDQLKELQQELLQGDLSSEGLLPHVPKFEVLDSCEPLRAVCKIGGEEFLKSQKSFVPVPSVESHTPDDDKPILNPRPVGGQSPVAPASVQAAMPDNFGFVEVPVEVPEKSTEQKEPSAKKGIRTLSRPTVTVETDDEAAENDAPVAAPKKPGFLAGLSSLFKKKSQKVKAAPRPVPAPRPPSFRKPLMKKPGIIVGIVIGLLLIGSVAGYGFLATQTKAQVTLWVKTERISQNVVITLDPKIAATDETQNILKANRVTKQVTSSEETSTTGSKLIGEKATGSVTIFNRTENVKVFPKGTEIKADNKSFLLDEEVTVASASSKTDQNFNTVVEPGKQDAKVVASAIGAEYNLGKDTEFSVANFGKDSYVARSTGNFDGGTSREIQAVSKDDQTRILSSLKAHLITQAQEELEDSLESGQYLVLTGKSTVTDQKYSAEVGEETNMLKLTLTVEVEGYAYSGTDLRPIASAVLSGLVPSEGMLIEDRIEILSSPNQSTSSGKTASASAQVTLNADLSAEYEPIVDQEFFKSELAGKTLEQAKNILNSRKEIKQSEIQLMPSIAKTILGKLPSNKDQITIEKKL